MKKIMVSIADQRLQVLEDGHVVMDCSVSTGRNGAGEENGSERTPRGRHIVRAKIGDGCAAGTVFVARRPTGEIYTPGLRKRYPDRDWILTRILWLSGTEPGRNRLESVDTMRRYIYIHGSPDEDEMGVPGSHGCIKMSNPDVIALYDRIPVGTVVEIHEHGF